MSVTVISPIMTRTNFFAHSSFGKMGQRGSISISAHKVAKSIEGAVNSKRLEITVPKAARYAVWARQTFPYVLVPYIGKLFNKQFEQVKTER